MQRDPRQRKSPACWGNRDSEQVVDLASFLWGGGGEQAVESEVWTPSSPCSLAPKEKSPCLARSWIPQHWPNSADAFCSSGPSRELNHLEVFDGPVCPWGSLWGLLQGSLVALRFLPKRIGRNKVQGQKTFERWMEAPKKMRFT